MIENNIDSKSTQELIQNSLDKAISYADYREMVTQLALEGKSTGPIQTEALTNYTLLNDRRMKRFDKTVKIPAETTAKIKGIDRKTTMLVLTESWCGDAAPTVPVMNKIAELSENIELRIILRDENTELMNRFLTNGAMSIPKVLFLDPENKVLTDWGPRPKPAAQLVEAHKAEHGILLPEIKEEIQQWYNKDKGQTTLVELLSCLLLK